MVGSLKVRYYNSHNDEIIQITRFWVWVSHLLTSDIRNKFSCNGASISCTNVAPFVICTYLYHILVIGIKPDSSLSTISLDSSDHWELSKVENKQQLIRDSREIILTRSLNLFSLLSLSDCYCLNCYLFLCFTMIVLN